MTPYASFLYFGIALYLVVPLVLAGCLGVFRSVCGWVVVSSALMLALQFGASRMFALAAGYAVAEWIIARAFLWACAAKNSSVPRPKEPGKKFLMQYFAVCVLAVLPLLFVKVSPHFAPLTKHPLGFAGISYVTFRALDVLIGIRDGAILEVPFFRYLSYLLFFPTISSGPIDRFKRFSEDWKKRRNRTMFLSDLDSAIQHIFRGFLYKFLIAVMIDRYWIDPIGKSHTFLDTVSYMYAYSLFLFFDFAGYSAFAVGFSYLIGIHSPENFNLPFLSRNIKEFWDRWHISLSWWFRDHVYMRFVMMASRGKWFASRYTASYIGFFITMGLMGFWHGLQLHFIAYGFYHAALLVTHDYFARWNKKKKLFTGRLSVATSWFITMNAVCFGLLIFSGRLF